MNEIMIAICGDSADDCSILGGYLHMAARELKRQIQVCTFPSCSDFPKKAVPVFDMIFLYTGLSAINMDAFIRMLRNHNFHLHLVLLSDDPESIAMGYQYCAENYLIKPVGYPAIFSELKKYIGTENLCTDSFSWLSSRNEYFKIYHSRLRFVETKNRSLIFHYNGQMIRYPGRISEFKDHLPESIFFRCNNSYIVNLSYISRIVPEGSRYNLCLITGELLPLSRSRHRELLLRLLND